MAIFESIYFWEYAAFFIFIAVALKMGWNKIVASLDARSEAIRE